MRQTKHRNSERNGTASSIVHARKTEGELSQVPEDGKASGWYIIFRSLLCVPIVKEGASGIVERVGTVACGAAYESEVQLRFSKPFYLHASQQRCSEWRKHNLKLVRYCTVYIPSSSQEQICLICHSLPAMIMMLH